MVEDAGHVKIVDFGLAKVIGKEGLTATGDIVGTVNYMAPEQARGGDVDSRADIWAIGVVLYEMLAGRPPFMGDDPLAVFFSIQNSDPEPLTHLRTDIPEDILADLWKVVERCLRRDPNERYQKAADLRTQLRILRGEVTPPWWERAWRWVAAELQHFIHDQRRVAVAIGLVTLAVVLLATFPLGRPLLTFQTDWPWARLWIGPQPLPTERYLAVLPFSALPDSSARALCDGLVGVNMQRLMRVASSVDSLWVIPCGAEPDAATTPAEALYNFGVNLVMTGSVMCSGDTITLAADLVDTKSMRRLRHFAISDPMANLATWQYDLIQKMARMLGVSLAPGQVSLLKTGCTNVPAAYRPFLRGYGYLHPSRGTANPDSAIAAFGRATLEDAAFAQGYAELGQAYLARYNNTKATAQLDTAAACAEKAALVSDPPPASAFWSAGEIDLARKLYADALRGFVRAVDLDSGCFEAHMGIGKVYDMRAATDSAAIDSAAAGFARAIRLRSRSYSPYYRLGYLYYMRNRFESAIKPFQVLVKLRPRQRRGYIGLGASYFGCDSLSEAKQVFEQFLEIQRTCRDVDTLGTIYALNNLGSVYFYEERYAKADSAYNEALKLSPGGRSFDYSVYAGDAEARYWMGDRDSARALFGEAVRLAEQKLAKVPDDVSVMADLASYLSMLDDRVRAEALLVRVTSHAPSDKNVLERIAETYEQMGNRDQALLWLDKALAARYAIKYVEHYPNWRNLRSDPRYRDLRERYRTPTSSTWIVEESARRNT
jgi:serine/threonine-protein kinase